MILLLIITVMHSRRDSSVVRQVLQEIISTQPICPNHSASKPTRSPSVDNVKLREAVKYLEKKVERQNSENKMLGDQLSREIALREEMARLLSDEKDKNSRLAQHLSKANNTVTELRKRIGQMEKKEGWQSSEVKVSKYR